MSHGTYCFHMEIYEVTKSVFLTLIGRCNQTEELSEMAFTSSRAIIHSSSSQSNCHQFTPVRAAYF